MTIRGDDDLRKLLAGELTKVFGIKALFVLPFAQDHRNDLFVEERKEMAVMIGREKMRYGPGALKSSRDTVVVSVFGGMRTHIALR